MDDLIFVVLLVIEYVCDLIFVILMSTPPAPQPPPHTLTGRTTNSLFFFVITPATACCCLIGQLSHCLVIMPATSRRDDSPAIFNSTARLLLPDRTTT